MARKPASLLILLASALLAGGCATGRTAAGFPEPGVLAELAEAPPPHSIFESDVLDVQTWELGGPFPETMGAETTAYASPWGSALKQAALDKPGALLLSEGMHCVARELGRFHLAHHARPSKSLRRFITSRCGSPATQVMAASVSGEVPDEVTDEELFEQWQESVQDLVGGHLGAGSRTAGLWFGRRDGQAVVMLATAERKVHLTKMSAFPDEEGHIIISGELMIPAERMRALINHGRYGVKQCEQGVNLQLPRFAFRCKVDPDDDYAWVQVGAFPPGRILGDTVLEMLSWPKREPANTYTRPSYTDESRSVKDEASFIIGLVELLNGVRARAELGELTLEPEQSKVATRLAPHYFSAIVGGAPETMADTVVLGLRAGWEVEGTVEYGLFAAQMVGQTSDLSGLVSLALERPGAREALLDPRATRIAVGPMFVPEANVLAAVMSTYALFDREQSEANARAVWERLDGLRRERDKPPLERLHEVDKLIAVAAVSIENGNKEPEEAFEELTEAALEPLGRSVYGWIVEAGSLDEFEFPDELLRRARLGVALGVAHHQPEGEPWGRYVILFLAAQVEGRVAVVQ